MRILWNHNIGFIEWKDLVWTHACAMRMHAEHPVVKVQMLVLERAFRWADAIHLKELICVNNILIYGQSHFIFSHVISFTVTINVPLNVEKWLRHFFTGRSGRFERVCMGCYSSCVRNYSSFVCYRSRYMECYSRYVRCYGPCVGSYPCT